MSGGGLTDIGGGTTPTAGTPATGTAGTQPAAASGNPLASMTGMMSNPLLGLGMTLGGAALGVYGLLKGKKWMMFSGAGSALSGVFMTYQGAKAKGFQEGSGQAQTAIQQFSQQVQSQLGPQFDAMQQKIAQQDQLIAQLQQQAAAGQAGTGTSPTGTGTDPTTGQPTSGTGAIDPSTGQPQQVNNAPASTIPDGQWQASALVGQAVTLGEARMPAGEQVAEPGAYVISQPIGSADGYASAAEADAAARSAMSTDMGGTKNYRWLVVEHGGKYYGFLATKDQGGSPQLPPANGNVVAWHALRAVETGDMNVKWMEYTWSKDSGSGFNEYGTANPQAGATVTTGGNYGGGPTGTSGAGGSVGGTSADPAGASSGTTGTTGTVDAGGPTAGAQPAPAPGASARALEGRTFAINAATVNGNEQVDGGQIQLQKLLDQSQFGYDTPAQAADAARLAREAAGGGSRWSRWVTLQLGDGKYYVFEAQLVNKPTVDVGSGGKPMHVFGGGFAEYFDGSKWVAQADSGIA